MNTTNAKRSGRVVRVSGNMVMAEVNGFVIQNEVVFILTRDARLKAEVIRVRARFAEMQVFESTAGLKIGDKVEFTEELLSVELGPGLLGQIFDGLQNPLPALAEECGFFLKRGVYKEALQADSKWEFTPIVQVGARLSAGDTIGVVPEKIFKHRIMIPFVLTGILEVISIKNQGKYNLNESVARVKDESGKEYDVFLKQTWPVKIAIGADRKSVV